MIAGLDHQDEKCAFGVMFLANMVGSHTITESEALEIFRQYYADIRRMADQGDPEAMVMVAQSIRYGFDDDPQEPYVFWLQKASELGYVPADELLQEVETFDPFELDVKPMIEDDGETPPPDPYDDVVHDRILESDDLDKSSLEGLDVDYFCHLQEQQKRIDQLIQQGDA